MAPDDTAPPPRPLRGALHLLYPLASVAVLALLLAGGALLGVRALLASDGGSAWLLARLPGVQVQGWQGALLGERWQAERLVLHWNGGRASLVVEGLRAEGVQWRWRPDDPAPAGGAARPWAALGIASLTARRAVLDSGPASSIAPTLPDSLALPLQLTLDRLRLTRLEVDRLAPAEDVAVDGLVLDSRPGAQHALQRVALRWQGLAFEAQARLGHAKPLPLQASASVRPAGDGETPRWGAVLTASGPLERLALAGTLRGLPLAGRAAPSLDLQAELLPLRAWPLERLALSTRELDLSALLAAAPQTRLSGEARLGPHRADAPIAATLNLTNALPGRWNEGRLPVASATLGLQGRSDAPDRVEVPAFELRLAGSGARGALPAGGVSGRALWQRGQLEIEARLDRVAPQQLDGRLAAMQLGGPLTLRLDGLPSPDGRSADPAARRAELRLQMDGLLDGMAQAATLRLHLLADADGVELREAQAATGSARAEASGRLRRAAGGAWTLATQGRVADFDPLPWFPGEAGSPWRQGRHRLSGDWRFDLRLPADARALAMQSPLAMLPRVAGTGRLALNDTLLAGVPLSGELTLDRGSSTGTLRAEFRAAGNTLRLDGSGDPAGDGQADRLALDLQADSLAALAPVARLHTALAAWAPRAGSAAVQARVVGRWPALRTEGRASVTQLQAGTLGLRRGAIDWGLDSSGDAPLSMKLDLAGLQLGAQRAELLRGTVSGTPAAHRIDVDGALPVVPSAQAGTWLGLQRRAGTRAQLRAQGRWQPAAEGGGRWTAEVQRLYVGSWDGGAIDAPPAPAGTASGGTSAWLDARDLRGELRFAAGGGLLGGSVDAGSARLAEAATLRWDAVRASFPEAPGAPAQLAMRAELEPFALAPVLARLQPEAGWAGDLRVAARVDISAAERLTADVQLERRDGDLHVVSGDGTLLMGLTELRLAFAARDGLWTLRQDLAGRTLGELRGTLRVHTRPDARWPSPDDAIEGALQLRVGDIGIWAGWVPPGWRMSGRLAGEATLGGRFGSPRYDGRLSGEGLAVRNLLQGVAVRDGELRVRLEGDRAQVERFTLRGGDGRLEISGGAELGERLSAELQWQAERFRVLGRVDRQATVSGQGRLSFDAKQLRVDAKLALDEGLYDASRADAPTLDSDVSVRSADEEVQRTATDSTAAAAPRRDLALDIELDLGRKLRVRGRGLDAQLAGRLRLTTPQGRPSVAGTMATEGGTYAAYGQKLEIERGIVAFAGPYDNPRLDVLALRPNIDQRVGVAITGSLQAPRVRLFAEPELSENEKLSWLVLGRAPDGLGRTDTALLQRAAVALLAGEGDAPTDALMRTLGIDALSLRQGGEGDVRETVVTLGKQLSRRWYLGYERGVNATTGTWQLIYRIAQRFTLRAQSGLDSSLDVLWVWRVGETPAAPEGGVRKSVVPIPK